MTLNKTSIEWCDRTWNPVTGCLHGCSYCYARKISIRFRGHFAPTFHPERLNDPANMKKPQTIFVCSMADLFGDWVPDLWIEQVFAAIQKARQHTYIFLTKNPARYLKIPGTYFSSNVWFGATVDGLPNVNGYDTISTLQKLPSYVNTFISFEPLLKDVGKIDLTGIRQIIIGAQTNPDQCAGLESVMKICEDSDKVGAKVFMKDSLACRWMDRELRRELCWQVQK